MSSAPEHADELLRLGAGLPLSVLDRLAFKWMDRCVRVHAPAALERCGYSDEAQSLRALPKLLDREACVQASPVLGAATRNLGGVGGSEMETLACIFCLIGTIETDLREDGSHLKALIVGAVTAARCAGAWHEEREQLADVKAAVG